MRIKILLPYFFALVLLASAIAHVAIPEIFAPIIPHFISVYWANYLAATAELSIAVLLFLPKYRNQGGLLFMALMIAFLPLHLWELFRENPAVGKHPAPLIRLVFQFVLI